MATRRLDKDLKKLIAKVRKEPGWRVEDTKDGVQCFAPDGVNIVTIHLTEGDQKRAMRNSLGRLRKYGFDDRS